MLSGKDIEYQNFTLGDIGVIELLITHRYKYDDYLFMKQDSAQSFDVADILPFNEEVLMTYATLDQYIAECEFSEIQLKLLKMLEMESTHDEIAEGLRLKKSTITGRINTICKRIKAENDWQWRRHIYTHRLGLRTKMCSKCKEQLPGTVEFYSDYSRSRDGFHSVCRKCRL